MFIQVYKAIFTSPSSARDISEEDDTENVPPAKSQRTSSGKKPARRNMASKVNLNQVGFTLLHAVLCLFAAASFILTCNLRVHGPNFMEDLTTKDSITILLISSKIPLGLQRRIVPKTYLTGGRCEYSLPTKNIQLSSDHDRKIFPTAAAHRQSTTSASRKAFKQQRAALEHEAA
jgi:hypothetical protein